MGSNSDDTKALLQAATGVSSESLIDLWDAWLIQQGYTKGTVLDRLTTVALARGVRVNKLLNGNYAAVSLVLNSGPPTPSAPLTVTAARSASQTCSISFQPPATQGTSAITGYTATSTPGSLTGSAASSPISVAGLTNGVEYTFTVHATNSSGNGPESAASNIAIPATVPGAPTSAVATAGNGSASIAFSAPASNGGSTITSYTATSNPGGITGSASSSPITVPGLTNNTDYTFTVVATNQYGNSSASSASNIVTPVTTVTGPFDNLYTVGWTPISDTVVQSPNVQSIPAKSSGIASPSYTDSDYGTKIFRVSSLTDSPNNGTTKMRHEYSRRQPFNCDSSKFLLQNSSGFYFVYDANTFTCLDGGITTSDVKLGAVGTNTIYPKDPRDWIWHPTDPNKIIFFPQTDGLTAYEFDVVTKVLTTKFSLAGRLGAYGMGAATKITSSEGRPSDNGRYWGWQVFNGSATLGYITYDMQTDTITGALTTTDAANNVTMSPSGAYIVISAGGAGLTYAQCAASANIRGTRAYARDFSSFKQVHITTTHMDVGYDYQNNEVMVSLNPGSSSWTDIAQNSLFYITLAGGAGPVQLIDLGNAMSQWNSHYSGCCAPTRHGWAVFSAYDETNRAGFPKYLDNNVALVELKPAGSVYRLADHRTTRLTYWQEPHATISRDGLRVLYSCSWDNTTSSQAALEYMIGLPSWIYGGTPPTNLLPNGTFTDATGWSLGTSCTVTGGKLWCNNNAGNSTNTYALTTLAPGTYEVTYTISEFNAGNVTARINTGAGLFSGATRGFGTVSAGTYTDSITITAQSTDFNIRATRSSGTNTMDFKIDDVKIVQVS